MSVELKCCPFCGNPNPGQFRYMVGTNVPSPNGDMFCIICDCGCRFEVYQDELFDDVEILRDSQERYGEEITDDDLWDMLYSKWNDRLGSTLREIAERHKETLTRLAEDD